MFFIFTLHFKADYNGNIKVIWKEYDLIKVLKLINYYLICLFKYKNATV